MRILKTVEVPAKTCEAFDKLKCELCGKETANERNWSAGADLGGYGVNETSVELAVGATYPEGGSLERIHLDICDECFESKLIPWFESLGGKPRKRETDW